MVSDEKKQDPDRYPLVRGIDPRIRIHTKISWIRNTERNTAAGSGIPGGAHRQRQLSATLQQGLPCLRPTRPTARHTILR
jgi:hypothetical protein